VKCISEGADQAKKQRFSAHRCRYQRAHRRRIVAREGFEAKFTGRCDFDSVLMVDEEKLPSGIELPRTQLGEAPHWPGDPVIVVDAGRATRSHIVSPLFLPLGVVNQVFHPGRVRHGSAEIPSNGWLGGA
jgi:hypothetical protein